MSSKLVIGQRCTKAAVSATMLGGSGCSCSGVKPIRPFPFFVVTSLTLVLVRRLALIAASAVSIFVAQLLHKHSCFTRLFQGCVIGVTPPFVKKLYAKEERRLEAVSLLRGGNKRPDGRNRDNAITLLPRGRAGAFMGRTLEGFSFRPVEQNRVVLELSLK